ncbi:MAG: hypothetical protein KDE27_06410 [Planctomycetes bacterium]|nr:hypothetical protein [Planctomycetota bacterium]
MSAFAKSADSANELPASWHALPPHLQKPFWTIRETMEATDLSRATITRLRADPRSGFPKFIDAGRLRVSSLAVLQFMEP